jgi:hypothetical protein
MTRLRQRLRRGRLSTRRSFIRTTGAALSVPLAAVGATLPATLVADGDPLLTRLGMLEDVNAIRALNQEWARRVNAGEEEKAIADAGIRSMASDGFGEQDVIEISPDRQTAIGVMHCTVEIETVIGPSCPLVEMAREQGGGVVTRVETGVFENVYARRDGIWKIQRSAYRSV